MVEITVPALLALAAAVDAGEVTVPDADLEAYGDLYDPMEDGELREALWEVLAAQEDQDIARGVAGEVEVTGLSDQEVAAVVEALRRGPIQ